MATSRWLALELTLTAPAAELAGDALLELGATGWELCDEQTFRHAGPGTVTLLAYLPEEAGPPERLQQDALRLLRSRIDPPAGGEPLQLDLRVQPVDDPGWAEAWKRFFRPIPVGQRLLVRPPWEPVKDSGGRAVLTLDPGLAFGTGHHPSTRLCLEVIEALPAPAEMLDVGCGSGILAIAAALLGTPRALGVDTDPEAVRVAQENAVLNGVEHQTRFGGELLSEIIGQFPLVVANILSGTLIMLAPELVTHLAPGGRLVLAGILATEASGVAAVYQKLGLTLLEQRDGRDDGGELWSALVLQRTAEP